MARFKPPGQCPVCGEWIPKGVAACDECGACEKSGWKSDAQTYDGLGLPDDEFDYDDFVAREFGGKKSGVSGNTRSLWFWAGVVLLVALVWAYVVAGMR